MAPTPHSISRVDPPVLAPRWHTAILVAFLVTVGVLGAVLTTRGAAITSPPTTGSRIVTVYLPMLLVQIGLVVYVVRIGRARSAFDDLIGAPWSTSRRALQGLAAAVALFAFIVGGEAIYAYFYVVSTNAAVLALLPTTLAERAVWIVVAVSVGVCEELVYRGYLFVQLAALARSRPFAVVAQAALFGLAHGQQGAATAIRFSIYGVAFAVVALHQRSLLSGIAAHVAIDVSSGLMHH